MDELPEIRYIENQLKLVVINLIKNSIEAMPNGGILEITVKEKGANQIFVQVKDQGCGVGYLTNFFCNIGNPFYTTKEKGTGLGLMTVYKIVRTHNGTVHITSTLNRGTCIGIHLPINGD